VLHQPIETAPFIESWSHQAEVFQLFESQSGWRSRYMEWRQSGSDDGHDFELSASLSRVE
jgi:hypothetical protein